MVLAYDGINLPIANAGFFGNDGGAFVNTDTISDLAVYPWSHISFYVSCGSAVNAYTRCRHCACLSRYVDRCVHGLSGCLTHLLTVLILVQDSNPAGFWLQSEESELASSSGLLRLVFYDYPL